jgi:protein required for attachment to host cells
LHSANARTLQQEGESMKSLKTWALIADGARARILQNNGAVHGDALHGETAHEWMPVEGMVFHGDNSATHDLVTDRQGRSFSSAGAGRSALEAHTDPHRDQKTKFANHLADVLAKQLQAGAYHRLIIAAPPVTLGYLRSAISDHVRGTVIAEFANDLTKIPNHEISSHLKAIVA